MDIRLNKLISDSGICSRREADKYIEEGHVTVNGKQPHIGQRVNENDIVIFDDLQIKINKRTLEQSSTKKTDLEIEFDFTLVEELEFKKDGYRNVLEGVVSSSNANKFLSLENKQISDIQFKSYSNGESLQSLEFVYTQNGFKVERTVDYTYVDIVLELPAKNNIKNF